LSAANPIENTPPVRDEAPVERVQAPAPRESGGDGGASLVFWILVTMALLVFTPCMILPAWREYQQAELAARVRRHEADQAELRAKRLEARLDAIHNDPVVIARLARRDLRCTLPGEVGLAVRPVNGATPAYLEPWLDSAVEYAPVELAPVKPPVAVLRLTHYLPRLNYDALFCASPTRETLLAMSVTLLAAAFIIFWPRCPRA